MFPFSATGEVRVGTNSTIGLKQLLPLVAKEIDSHRPSSVTVSEQELRFKAGFRLVSSWNLLLPWTCGTLRFSQHDEAIAISYRLSFLEMLCIGTTLALMAGGAGWTGYAHAALLFGAAWIWLVGGNYWIGVLRFRAFLRRVVRLAASQAMIVSTESSDGR